MNAWVCTLSGIFAGVVMCLVAVKLVAEFDLPRINCASCGVSTKNYGRGLCMPCYKMHEQMGTLKYFPPKPTPAALIRDSSDIRLERMR